MLQSLGVKELEYLSKRTERASGSPVLGTPSQSLGGLCWPRPLTIPTPLGPAP